MLGSSCRALDYSRYNNLATAPLPAQLCPGMVPRHRGRPPTGLSAASRSPESLEQPETGPSQPWASVLNLTLEAGGSEPMPDTAVGPAGVRAYRGLYKLEGCGGDSNLGLGIGGEFVHVVLQDRTQGRTLRVRVSCW